MSVSEISQECLIEAEGQKIEVHVGSELPLFSKIDHRSQAANKEVDHAAGLWTTAILDPDLSSLGHIDWKVCNKRRAKRERTAVSATPILNPEQYRALPVSLIVRALTQTKESMKSSGKIDRSEIDMFLVTLHPQHSSQASSCEQPRISSIPP